MLSYFTCIKIIYIFKDFKDVHWLNIFFISSTLEVLKLLISKYFKEIQQENICFIPITKLVLKFDKSRDFKDLQLKNIAHIEEHFEVSKLFKSN